MDAHEGQAASRRLRERREFLRRASAGTVLAALGGAYVLLGDPVAVASEPEERRPDGRTRVPPGQRVIERLKPMGGRAGNPSSRKWRLRVHGEVERPYELKLVDLLYLPQVDKTLDVHCVTGWSVLGAEWRGVTVKHLADKAEVKATARYVIFEAAHGYTANVPLKEALAEDNLVAHRLDGLALPRKHGGPVRAVVPDLYFWKSAKWLTGIRFVTRDQKGYWEKRGYHNRGDPWQEERNA